MPKASRFSPRRAYPPHEHQQNHQTGWTLPTVMALVLLIASSGLSLVQQLWWQERLLKVQSERLRNREAATAVVLQAQHDLENALNEGCTSWLSRVSTANTPPSEAATPDSFPIVPSLRERLTQTDQAWGAAAEPGVSAPSGSNANTRSAWYWVEVSPPNQQVTTSTRDYRITALVQGALPGARIALEVIWGQDSQASTAAAAATSLSIHNVSRQWVSWRWVDE
jgi:Tfp pilus assembly protein PilX